MQPCDPNAVESFDYSKLAAAFAKLSKPAKRALLRNRIYEVKDLASWTLRDLLKLHGLGPASLPALRQVLHQAGLDFRS
ncbi:MAG TPA: hypothetical protein VK700_22525 [Steroidobacteraceae bacterium]|jgi:hypothetical protein|nr:hypothetical protein [Steroidobacteraceae bacterium]